MRSPKVKNKYNLTMKKINKLKVGDESKIKEPLFWRNNVINAWCINRIIGTDDDVKYGTDNDIWIGIYDKPYHNRKIGVHCVVAMEECVFINLINFIIKKILIVKMILKHRKNC